VHTELNYNHLFDSAFFNAEFGFKVGFIKELYKKQSEIERLTTNLLLTVFTKLEWHFNINCGAFGDKRIKKHFTMYKINT
jgi:hypothetical protein